MGAKYDAAEIGARVRDRRLTAGLTERDLASATGLAQSRVHRIETDPGRRVHVEDLARIARVLDVRVTWLLEGSPMRDRIVAAARAGEDADAPAAVDAVMHVLEIEERLNAADVAGAQELADVFHPRDRQETAEDWGRRTAESLRSQWGAASGPLLDLDAVVEDNIGAYVAHVCLPSAVDGLYLSDSLVGTTVLAVNLSGEFERQRFTLAHEVGHLVASDEHLLIGEGSPSKTSETAANAFARHLLLPLADAARLSGPWDELSVGQLAWRYRISPHVAAIQLKRAGHIPEMEVRRFAKLTSRHAAAAGGWWKRRYSEEVAAQTQRVSAHLAGRALRGWQDHAIGIRSLARLSGDDPRELLVTLRDAGIHRRDQTRLVRSRADLDQLLTPAG